MSYNIEELMPKRKIKSDPCKKIKRIKAVYHIGDLTTPRQSKGTSFEGDMLSISLDPDEWYSIAKLGGFPTWELRRQDGKHGSFIDYHRLSQKDKEKLSKLAVKKGLLVPSEAWELAWYDDELEREVAFVFDTKKEAEDEASDDNYENKKPKRIQTYRSTGNVATALAAEFAHIEMLNQICPMADGVWWEDDYAALSAPRGGIFQNKLKEWKYSDQISDDEDI